MTLANGGVILDGQFLEARPSGVCASVLPTMAMRAGPVAQGFVVYRIPDGFARDGDAVTLAYLPTRWGGATGVDVKLGSSLLGNAL